MHHNEGTQNQQKLCDWGCVCVCVRGRGGEGGEESRRSSGVTLFKTWKCEIENIPIIYTYMGAIIMGAITWA